MSDSKMQGETPLSPGSQRDARTKRTATLWERVSATENEQERARLREEIVVLNMPIARAIANRYRSRGLALEDLEQVAMLGLVKAVRGFDPTQQKDFLSYAVPTASGEVKRYFRDFGWTVRPPRRVQELQSRINAAVLPDESEGRVAHPAAIAARLSEDVDRVVEAMACNGAFSPSSLDAPLGPSGSSESLGDLLTARRSDYHQVETGMVLQQALSTLSPRDRLVLKRRFVDDRTQREIGTELGVSQMQVSRLLIRILSTLRELVAPVETELMSA